TATAASSGGWGCRPPSALADGAYLFQAVVTDPLSHLSNPSAARALVIDTTAPAAPALDQPPSRTRKREPTLSGTAEAGSSVSVIDANTGEPVCAATATSAGTFQCAAGTELALGEHSVTATATDAAGNASLQALAVAFTVTDALPSAPTIESPANGTELVQRRPMISPALPSRGRW